MIKVILEDYEARLIDSSRIFLGDGSIVLKQ